MIERRSHRLLLGLLGSCLMVPMIGAQQDWYVDASAPGCASGTGSQANPFCDIRTAILAAQDGDTIHIAPGTYVENIRIQEDVSLVGTDGHLVTILDGDGLGSVVRVVDATVTLTGLTLTNGTGTPFLREGSLHGGGLFMYSRRRYHPDPSERPRRRRGPRVELVDCLVTENTATHGAGIANGHQWVDFASIGRGGDLTLTNTTVSNNTADGFQYFLLYYIYARGGGISSHGKLTLFDSTVSGNQALERYYTSWGGGIWSGRSGKLYVKDSLISENYAVRGGGIWAEDVLVQCSTVADNTSYSGGGGIFCGDATITDTLIDNNSTLSSPFRDGGGVFVFRDALLLNSTVSNNNAADSGGGLHLLDGYLTVINTAVFGNRASRGAGLNVGGPRTLVLTNSTVTGNRAITTGGGIHVDNYGPVAMTDVDVRNSILWGNTPDEITVDGVFDDSVEYSDVEGGWPGVGNIALDPLFIDPLTDDFGLSPGSPCIDAGDNTAVPLGILFDLLGFPRFVDDPLTPDTGNGTAPIVDMGAIEFQ